MQPDEAIDLALEWAGRKLPAFPIFVRWDAVKAKTNKVPLTAHGFKDATTDPDRLREMFSRAVVPPDADLGVGLWPGFAGYVVLDDDGGLADSGLVLPDTYAPVTASGGRHYWFRKLDETTLITNTSPWTGIDVRADHGYVVAPGTEVTLRVGGEFAIFAWRDPGTYRAEWCPVEVWKQLALGHASTAVDGWKDYDPTQVPPLTAEAVEVFCTHLGGHHPRIVAGPPVHVQITRPEKGQGTSASIGFVGPGVTKVFTSNWPGLAEGAVLNLHELRRLLEGPSSNGSTPTHSPLNLDPDVWMSRPHLAVIRDAARTRLVPPDAVLGAVLARVCAFTDYRIKLPPIVGSAAGLSLLVVLLGEPEAGKSAAWAVAAELIPKPTAITVADDLKYGSGQGWIEALLDIEEVEREEGDKGPKKLRKVQKIHHALGWIDEGSRLAVRKDQRNGGSSIAETLRSIFSDQALGETNASVETYRHVDRGQYVFGVGMGLQPGLAGDLLAGSDAGDPQRWCWAWSYDPGYSAGVEWDGRALPWSPQTFDIHWKRQTLKGTGGYQRVLIDVPSEIVTEIREHRIERLRNPIDDPLAAHVNLLRLKVAEAFALLDQRLDLNAEDWSLAGHYIDVSARVRGHAAEVVSERQASNQRSRRAVERQEKVADDDAIEVAKVQRSEMNGAKAIARKVAREGPITLKMAQTATAGRDRANASFEDMLSVAEAAGWVSVGPETVAPGKSPAP